MSKSFYNLLREKNKLEKERNKALLKTFEVHSCLRNVWGSERKKILEEYKKGMEDLKIKNKVFEEGSDY